MKRPVLFTFLLLAAQLGAQSYVLDVSNEAYAPLTNTTSVTNGDTWDDPEVTIPIGFVFDLFEQNITELELTGLGTSLIVGDIAGQEPVMALFSYGADVIDRGDIDGVSQSEIEYSTVGSVGSRVFSLEWENVGFYEELYGDSETNEMFANFQIRLYEGTGIIEMHYGQSSIPNPQVAFEGASGPLVSLIGPTPTDGSTPYPGSIQLVGDPADPTTLLGTLFDEYQSLDASPADGTLYTFSPMATSVRENEIGTLRALVDHHGKTLILQGMDADYLHFDIIDMSGRTLISDRLDGRPIDVSNLPVGAYIVRSRNEQSMAVGRFIMTDH